MYTDPNEAPCPNHPRIVPMTVQQPDLSGGLNVKNLLHKIIWGK